MVSDIKIENNKIELILNPKIYSKETLFSASYIFLDKAYIILDENKDGLIVKIMPKDNHEDLKKLGGNFLNELINFEDYFNRAKKTDKLREMMLQKILVNNDVLPEEVDQLQEDDEEIELDEETKKLLEDIENEEFDDPEGIAMPWEEKYGKKKDNQDN